MKCTIRVMCHHRRVNLCGCVSCTSSQLEYKCLILQIFGANFQYYQTSFTIECSLTLCCIYVISILKRTHQMDVSNSSQSNEFNHVLIHTCQPISNRDIMLGIIMNKILRDLKADLYLVFYIDCMIPMDCRSKQHSRIYQS